MPSMGTTLVLAAIALSLAAFSASASRSLVHEGIRLPCTFADSVNLTDYEKLANGSYVYSDIIIPPHLTAQYNYTLGSSQEHIPEKPHIRGCVCQLKPCLQFCCPIGMAFVNEYICEQFDDILPLEGNITLSSGDVITGNYYKKFTPQFGKPCEHLYPLEPWKYESDIFHIFENGSLFRTGDGKFLDRNEYCIGNAYVNDTDILTTYNCSIDTGVEPKYWFFAIVMLFSVPFILVTICVYIGIPELRTLHGKSLSCYLLNLAIGYCVLSTFGIMPQDTHTNITQINCSFWGFTAYFCFMASFFWLSVISFDLFCNISAPRARFNEKRFQLYAIYSWGLAFLFLAITMYAQLYLPDNWKPGIGGQKYCWLDVENGWSAFVYFYGPILIIIFFNIVMFVLTALRINSVQKEIARMVGRHDSQRNLRNEKDRFFIFLRLFIVMGVSWLMEIISYCIGDKTAWKNLFYITDFLNGIQGVVIFTLFVLKKKVKQHIANRCKSSSRREGQCHRITSSSINQPLNVMSSEELEEPADNTR